MLQYLVGVHDIERVVVTRQCVDVRRDELDVRLTA
jgi:hypothetical protein